MFVNKNVLFLVSNPFYQAYNGSDFLGKLIFLSIILASIFSWTLLVYKIWFTYQAKKNAAGFEKFMQKHKNNPLQLENEGKFRTMTPNPFYKVFTVLKKQTVDILNKNHRFGGEKEGASFLSGADMDYIEAHLVSEVTTETKHLEHNLFVLSTIVGLAPLLGLLGTVWGILTTFSELQTNVAGSTNQMVLGGISLALTTTVMGILTAIPALIGYNYLKNEIRNIEIGMEGFSNEMLSAIEMQYRKVDFR